MPPEQIRSAVLVGRDREREQLLAHLGQAGAGRGCLVLVRGPAGVGKSRLLQEVGRAAEGCICLVAGARDASEDLPQSLCVGLLRDCLRHPVGPAVDDLLAELAPHLRGEVLEGRAPGAPALSPEVRGRLLPQRLLRVLDELSRLAPVLVLADDLHRADSASLQTLAQLAGAAGSRRLLILGACRWPTAAGDRRAPPPALERLRSSAARVLELAPMSAPECRSLIGSCFDTWGFGADLLEAVCASSEGIPLKVLQLLDALRTRGVIYQRSGVWLDRPLRSEDLPSSLAAGLSRRLAGLGDDEVGVLVCAAAQGCQFRADLIGRALQRPAAQVLHVLARLEASAGLVRATGSALSFGHEVLHEALCGLLPQDRLTGAHRRLAEVMAEDDGAFPGPIAAHFLAAGLPGLAVPHLLAAADLSRENSAFWEARQLLVLALEAMGDDDSRRSERLSATLDLSAVDARLGDWERSDQLARQVLQRVDPRREGRLHAEALMRLAAVHGHRRQSQEAEALYGRVLETAAGLGDLRLEATASLRLGNIAFEQSRMDEAEGRFAEARRAAEELDDPALLAGATANLGVAATVRGDHRAAAAHYDRAYGAYRRAGHRFGVAQTCHNLGMCLVASQLWPDALACFEEGEAIARDLGTTDLLADLLVSKAQALAGLGQVDAAEGAVLGARLYYEQGDDPLGLAECDKVEAGLQRRRGRLAEAERRLASARERFDQLGNRLGAGECALELGLVHQAEGRLEAARDCFARARALFEEVGARHEVNRVEALLAAVPG